MGGGQASRVRPHRVGPEGFRERGWGGGQEFGGGAQGWAWAGVSGPRGLSRAVGWDLGREPAGGGRGVRLGAGAHARAVSRPPNGAGGGACPQGPPGRLAGGPCPFLPPHPAGRPPRQSPAAVPSGPGPGWGQQVGDGSQAALCWSPGCSRRQDHGQPLPSGRALGAMSTVTPASSPCSRPTRHPGGSTQPEELSGAPSRGWFWGSRPAGPHGPPEPAHGSPWAPALSGLCKQLALSRSVQWWVKGRPLSSGPLGARLSAPTCALGGGGLPGGA